MQRLRARSSVVLTGADTVLMDAARLTVRGAELGLDAETTALALQRPPLRVLVDGRLRVPLDAPFFQAGPALVVTVVAGCEETYRRAGHEALVLGQERVDLAALLRELAARGANEVLVEAGPRLVGAFASLGLIDEYQLFMAAKFRLLGAAAAGASARAHERGARVEDRRHPCGGRRLEDRGAPGQLIGNPCRRCPPIACVLHSDSCYRAITGCPRRYLC